MTVSKVKTFRNIIYAGITRGMTLACVGLTTTVVARNLTASDYGVVGFATIVIGFLYQFTDMGLARAAVRRPVLDTCNLQTVLSLRAILGLAAFVIALLISPFARHFLDHPATSNVIRLLALNFLVSTIGFLPRIVLTREMNYRALMIPTVVGAVAQCILSVVLILNGWSYWAVVVGNVGATLATGVVLQFTRRIPLGFHFDWSDAKEYLRFGMPLFGSGVLIFVLLNVDNFLVGSKLGSTQLGYYALAFTWGTFVCTLLDDTVNSVLLPTFAAMQEDLAAMRRWYLKVIELVSFIAVIANTALMANAPFFLTTFLGKGSGKWLPAMLSLRILCVYGIIRAITVPIGTCIMVRGHTKLLLQANALAGGVELLLLFLAIRAGRIELVAAAVLIAYLTQAGIYLPYLRQEFSITFGAFVAQVWPVLPAMTAGWFSTQLLPITFGGSFFALAVRAVFTGSIVAVTHGIFSRFRCFHDARGLIAQNLARVSG